MKRLIQVNYKNIILLSCLLACSPATAQTGFDGTGGTGTEQVQGAGTGAQGAGTGTLGAGTGAQGAGTGAQGAGTGAQGAGTGAQEAPKSIYDDASLKPRDLFNLANDELARGEYDVAIEGFSRARNEASFDNELRYSAAYNLGFAYAAKADSLGAIDGLDEGGLESAIEWLSSSVAWFRDAVRQRPSLDEARGNLEIVLKRQLNAQDLMAQKFNTPERQLDALIAAQREIRESARALSQQIAGTSAERDPISFQNDFRSIARMQREAMTAGNLAAENIANAKALIESKTEEARTQEEAYRKFQFEAVIPLLDQARQYMGSARRQMRDMSMNDALRQTNKAFYALKQAREQLDDPLRILGHISEDEQNFVRLAEANAVFKSPERLAEYRAKTQNSEASLPPWLNEALLSDTQQDVLERTKRVASFLEAVVSADVSGTEPSGADAEAAAEQRAQIGEALPLIRRAAEEMAAADGAVLRDDAEGALRHGAQSVELLALAMERFADLKHLVEIAYRSQKAMSGVVAGDIGSESPHLLSREQQKGLLSPALATNIERLERLSAALAKASAKAIAEVNKAAQSAQGQAAAQGQGDALKAQIDEQIAETQKLFEHAETLRAEAQAAMKRMAAVVDAYDAEGMAGTATEGTGSGGIVPATAEDAVWGELSEDDELAGSHLEQLRMLFFTIAEHVEELLRQQMSTLDTTTDVSTLAGDEQTLKLPAVVDRQRVHELTATQLARAITEQSEKMRAQAEQAPQGGEQAQEMAQRYGQAASEIEVAAASMRQAQTDLQSEDRLFSEALAQQKEAAEHLEKALEWLQPPQQQQQKQNDEQQQQNDEQQQNAQQQKPQQKMSKEQAEKKIEQIRSRDQARRKARESRNEGSGMPVVNDW